MNIVLFRVGKYKAPWEANDVDLILKNEFRTRSGDWDLRPSVYELRGGDDAELRRLALRVHAEHTTSFLDPPRKGVPNFDVRGLCEQTRSAAGRTAFSYANEAHRELVLADEPELRDFVATLVSQRALRERTFDLQATLKYIVDAAGSPEWLDAAKTNSHVAKWVMFAEKRANR